MGARRDDPEFVFDNEKWAHAIRVGPFAMAASMVTQGEFLAFVEDGGYEDRRHWTDAGWEWRERSLGHPVSWTRGANGWRRRVFDQVLPLDAHAPMVHVSLHEARAYCAWAGRRLPTEAEWEFAATNGGAGDRYPWGSGARPLANLDMRHSAPSADASEPLSKRGLHGMIGGAWEWTASAFEPYPEFAPDPYRDYSQPWFRTHFVLRGGSFATRARLAHNRYRNFYMPHRSDAFAGFRTCAMS
jgi:iron(II)-dependent oxidoreductase